MKNFVGIIILLLGMTLVCPAIAQGEQNIKIKVDGKEITFDQPPYEADGRTMVPVRAPMEAMGCTVKWDAGSQQASGSGKLWVDKDTGLIIYEEFNDSVKFGINVPVPDYGENTMQFTFNLEEKHNIERYDYGLPVNLPDISKAISTEEYDKIQSSLDGQDKI